MKALSIRQPHITRILHGEKSIEYRQWRAAPKIRGWIALHAGLKVDWDCVSDDELDLVWPIGGILGLGFITGATLVGDKDVQIAFSMTHWLPEPIRYTGQLGFFDIKGQALAKLKRQAKRLGGEGMTQRSRYYRKWWNKQVKEYLEHRKKLINRIRERYAKR